MPPPDWKKLDVPRRILVAGFAGTGPGALLGSAVQSPLVWRKTAPLPPSSWSGTDIDPMDDRGVSCLNGGICTPVPANMSAMGVEVVPDADDLDTDGTGEGEGDADRDEKALARSETVPG